MHFHFKRGLRALVLYLALVLSTLGSSTLCAAPQHIESQGISIDFTKANGISISVDEIPFSHSAQLSLTDPSWSTTYYSYTMDDHRLSQAATSATQKAGANGVRVVTALRSAASTAAITQTIEILPGRAVKIALEIRPDTTTPLILENRIASIGEAWLANRPFQATLTDESTTAGRIFPWAPSAKVSDCMIAEKFRSVSVDSAYGPLVITAAGTDKMVLFDYRKNEWAGGQRYFWLGMLGRQVPQQGLHYELTIQFPPRQQPLVVGESLATPVNAAAGKIIYQPPTPLDKVTPTPRQVEWGQGSAEITGDLSVHLDMQQLAHITRPAHEKLPVRIVPVSLYNESAEVIGQYAERWHQRYSLKLDQTTDKAKASVQVEFINKWDLSADQADQAYRISLTDSVVYIQARTAAGLRNAFATLEQLFRRTDNGKVSIRRARIYDYPAMPFRGIHFFSGRNGAPLQQKMITEILAPLKINKLVYQVDYLEWDTLPPPHHARYSMTKREARQVADTARDAGIEVIPLINTFGHNEWLVGREAYRQLADDPGAPYAYDPANPEVYRLCERIYDEAVQLFHPRTIHIGHDEVTMNGFPVKPANKAIGATQLLISDILHYHKYLGDRGVRTMIWGDMFLAPGESPDACLAPSVAEAERRRKLLPSDVVIADWHYKPAPADAYKSLSIFSEAGFDTIACTWDQPQNIRSFAEAAANTHELTTASRGLLQTTWAGYSFDEQSFAENFSQYAAYVLAAEAAWTGKAENSSLDYQAEFLQRWTAQSATLHGWQGNLAGIANFDLTTTNAIRLGLAPRAFQALTPGIINMTGYSFVVAPNTAHPQAHSAIVMTSAPLTLQHFPPSENLYLAVASRRSWPDKTPVAHAVIEHADGRSTRTELSYGREIFSINDRRQSFAAPLIWDSAPGGTPDGAAAIHLHRIPATDAKKITLAPHPGMEILLVGVSGASPD